MSRTAASLSAVLLVCLFVASGCGDDDMTKGSCDGRDYELSAESDENHTEVSFDLTAPTSGESWQIVIEQDGKTILDTTAVTDEEGDLDAETTVDKSDDTTTFTVTATPESGEACTASVDH